MVQLDLDRFKQINDTLGHAAGDYVLVVTAQRMRDSCRASDLCARLGGDEFVMILNGAGSTEDINMLARRILAHINEPIVFQGTTILPGASGGIAVYPIDADNAQDLLVHADLALYSAKKLGGGNFSFFSEELRRELDYRKQLEHDIKVAISERAFQVYFQPQVSLTDGTISGIEALVRWNHHERGMISPGEFIPVAEKCGFMPEIGRIVIGKAINEAAEWNRAGIAFGRLAVNVSGTELREHDFDAFLFETLEKAGLPPQKLSLEIVESVILDDEKTGIAAKLRHIRPPASIWNSTISAPAMRRSATSIPMRSTGSRSTAASSRTSMRTATTRRSCALLPSLPAASASPSLPRVLKQRPNSTR